MEKRRNAGRDVDLRLRRVTSFATADPMAYGRYEFR